MNYMELSARNVKDKSRELAKKISDDGFSPELVIFIARGAYQIGKIISDDLSCPLSEIKCTREGGRIKDKLNPMLKKLPRGVKTMLRRTEMFVRNNFEQHESLSERYTEYDIKDWEKYKDVSSVLIVDDSADSGLSLSAAVTTVSEYFDKAVVKTAVINYFDEALTTCKIDYYLYSNTYISGPWSNDSKEHEMFLKKYNDWKKETKEKGM